MKRLFLSAVILSILFTTACTQKTEQITEKTVPVKVFTAKLDNIGNYVTATGTITAFEDVVLYAKVSEKIDHLLVKPGDKVTQGQTLAVQYNEILKQSVEAAETGVRSAGTQFKLAEQEFARMKNLYVQNAISIQQYDQVKTQTESSKLALEGANVQLKLAKEQYENSFIKAPFAGTVAAVQVEKNQMIAAGVPVAQVISPGSMKAKVKIPSTEIAGIVKGQAVRIQLPTVPNKTYDGVVSEIDYAVDQFSKNLQVEIAVKNTDSNVKSGLFAEFLIETSTRKNSLIIPENAILSRTEITIDKETGLQESVKKHFVFVVKNGKAELIEIQTGIGSGGRVEVTYGLNVGDVIVVVGQNIVKSGEKVKIID
ncbi:MAG: efflux RND transporter periplasmic adaptor subunit [Melioribacteraceae bacterium]